MGPLSWYTLPMDAVEFVAWCDERRSRLVIASRSDFYDRIERERIDRCERLDFHLIIHCVDVWGRHEVDFETVDLRPDTALFIQPGQVQRLSTGAAAGYDARFLAFAAAPSGPMPIPAGANTVVVDEERAARLDLLYRLAASRPADRSPGTEAAEDGGLRDLFFAAFGFAEVATPKRSPEADHPAWAERAFTALRHDLEHHLDAGDTVQRRAARLGYSTRTLDRACRVIAGTTAKRVCDDRLALEARRLLSLPEASSTRVSDRLGFSEPSNFTKFMKRTTGHTPSTLLAR